VYRPVEGPDRHTLRYSCDTEKIRSTDASAVTVGPMANEQGPLSPRARVHAGTAFKVGFFGAFGVFVFTLALTLVAGVIALVLAALNVLPGVAQAFRAVTGS
jgi:hypothetical protein